jgi:cystathionine beta-lyase
MNTSTHILQQIPVDPLTGSISTPIYQTATFVQEAPGVNKGFDYARTGNPTRKVLENLIASLEHGDAGFAFATGLAAIDAVVKLLSTGDEIVAVNDIYGGAYRLFTHVYAKLGITVHYVDTTEVEEVRRAITPKTKFIWLESPTNPTLKISDIAAISALAKAQNIQVVVDNTFASPLLQQPITLGADIVIHSATKYLAGHSDLVAGLVVTANPELSDRIKFIQNATGGILGPQDCWLTIRGIETAALRIEKQSKTALEIAQFLCTHPLVNQVYYPGLPQHKNHAVAAQQQGKTFGGIIAFDLNDDNKTAALEFVQSTRLFHLAESLGGVKSLCCIPCEMTHKSIPKEQRLQSGIGDSLIRLSCGIEDSHDLLNDIKSALNIATANTTPHQSFVHKNFNF